MNLICAPPHDVQAFIRDFHGRPSKLLIPNRMGRYISTGLTVTPPPGHIVHALSNPDFAQYRLVFAIGTNDYLKDGELKIFLYNGGIEPQYVEHEQRIARIFAIPTVKLQLTPSNEAPKR